MTLEDILEQVVGEIHDEFDVVEKPLTLADGAVIFDAALNVRDLEAQYDIKIPEDPAYATVGGFVLDQLGFIPSGGETFDIDGLSLHHRGNGRQARSPREDANASCRLRRASEIIIGLRNSAVSENPPTPPLSVGEHNFTRLRRDR